MMVGEKVKYNCPFLDKRCKLLPCQKEMVVVLYERGESIRGLSKIFHVDRRLIQFTLFPERHERNLLLRQQNGGTKQYYEKDKNTLSMSKYRRRKSGLFKGVLQGCEDLPLKQSKASTKAKHENLGSGEVHKAIQKIG